MLFLGPDEMRSWSQRRGYALDERGRPILPAAAHCVMAALDRMNWSQLNWMGGYLASFLEPFEECMVWVAGWGAAPASENWHLFYRLRQSYGERRQLADAPGHLFWRHETADLATFLQLALLCGWDAYVLSFPAANSVFLSQDEALELYTDNSDAAQYARQWLEARPAARERAAEAE